MVDTSRIEELMDGDVHPADPYMLFAVSEVAAWLEVPEHVIRRDIRKGRLQAIRMPGRMIRIPRGDLREYLAAGGPRYTPRSSRVGAGSPGSGQGNRVGSAGAAGHEASGS